MLAVYLAFVAGAYSLVPLYGENVNGVSRKNHENVNGLDKTLICTDDHNNKMF